MKKTKGKIDEKWLTFFLFVLVACIIVLVVVNVLVIGKKPSSEMVDDVEDVPGLTEDELGERVTILTERIDAAEGNTDLQDDLRAALIAEIVGSGDTGSKYGKVAIDEAIKLDEQMHDVESARYVVTATRAYGDEELLQKYEEILAERILERIKVEEIQDGD